MKILVLSDSHGMTSPVRIAIERTEPDAVFFLGDGAREVQGLADEYDIPFYIVKGNCDCGFFQDELLVELNGVSFLLTHGHKYHVKFGLEEYRQRARAMGVKVALFGHTHECYTNYEDGLYMMNPGSCSCPREGKATFGCIETFNGQVVINTVSL